MESSKKSVFTSEVVFISEYGQLCHSEKKYGSLNEKFSENDSREECHQTTLIFRKNKNLISFRNYMKVNYAGMCRWFLFKLVDTRSVETCLVRGLRYANVLLTHSGVDTVRNRSFSRDVITFQNLKLKIHQSFYPHQAY